MTILSEEAVRIQDNVFSLRQYEKEYLKALKRVNMSVASIDQHEHSDKLLILLMQAFWEELPNKAEIRDPVFFAVCVKLKLFD